MKFKKIAQSLMLVVCFAAVATTLTACNNATQDKNQAAVVENSKIPEATNGIPSPAPILNDNGSVHRGESLAFVIIGAFKDKQSAEAFCKKTNESVAKSGFQSYYTVLESSNILNCDVKDPFIVAEAYPNIDAIQGYSALEFGKEYAQEGFNAHTFEGVYIGKDPIVVYGKDVLS